MRTCVTTNTGRFHIDVTQPASGANNQTTGPCFISAIRTAQAQNKTATVSGSNTCTSSRENVNLILVR